MSTENRDAGRSGRGPTTDGEWRTDVPTNGPLERAAVNPANGGGVRG